MNENLEYLKIFEDDVILGENAEVFLAQDEWLKTRFDFNDIFIIRLETFFYGQLNLRNKLKFHLLILGTLIF